MHAEYYIQTSANDPFPGPFRTQGEAAEALQKEGIAGEIVERYRLDEDEQKLCHAGTWFWLKNGFWGLIFSAIFFLGGLGNLGLTWLKSADRSSWVKVPATLHIEDIEKTEKSSRRGGKRTDWDMKAHYSYEYPAGGKTYTSSEQGNPEDSDISALARADGTFDTPVSTTCLVNPADPQQAVLFYHPRSFYMFIPALFGLLFGGAGLFSILRPVRKKLRLHRLAKEGKIAY